MTVSKEVALANLQPVPGSIEYAQGSPACYYKKLVLHSTADGKDHEQWFRINLQITEDLGQVRAGRTLSCFAMRDDCENYSQNCIFQASVGQNESVVNMLARMKV